MVVAAIALAERDGLAELSMRRLAAELGAGTMSLYNHVSDKEDLFDGMVEAVLAPVRIADSADWREIVATWATDGRQVLLDRIDLIPLVIAPERLVHLGRISGAVGSALPEEVDQRLGIGAAHAGVAMSGDACRSCTRSSGIGVGYCPEKQAWQKPVVLPAARSIPSSDRYPSESTPRNC